MPPRFTVHLTEGWRINTGTKAGVGGKTRLQLSATIIDTLTGKEHGTFASEDNRPWKTTYEQNRQRAIGKAEARRDWLETRYGL